MSEDVIASSAQSPLFAIRPLTHGVENKQLPNYLRLRGQRGQGETSVWDGNLENLWLRNP
ncbi:hypothetical protein [Nodularia sphaerocarpa]|uniref:hypothetical protein n=1 Tax=Nodularia sphaerocarpa TaxID=137816 RepID=UPI001EFBDAF2|nr:hypothetical protein [Nodularia sphaerocarpa]MDB9374225.1 hypothetical protein [Nodularia sphaerocarpa CS-585]